MAEKKILMNAKAIAAHTLGDEAQHRAIYRLWKEHGLPCFKLGGALCARPEKLDAWLAEQEQTAEAA